MEVAPHKTKLLITADDLRGTKTRIVVAITCIFELALTFTGQFGALPWNYVAFVTTTALLIYISIRNILAEANANRTIETLTSQFDNVLVESLERQRHSMQRSFDNHLKIMNDGSNFLSDDQNIYEDDEAKIRFGRPGRKSVDTLDTGLSSDAVQAFEKNHGTFSRRGRARFLGNG